MNTEKPIFICHNSQNSSHALALALVLEMKGFRTWIYELDSAAGADRAEQEARIISDHSIVMVALISMDTIRHPHSIIAETTLAKNRKRTDPSYRFALYTVGVTWGDLLNMMPQEKDLLMGIVGNVVDLLDLDPVMVMSSDFDLSERIRNDLFLTKLFQTDLRGLSNTGPQYPDNERLERMDRIKEMWRQKEAERAMIAAADKAKAEEEARNALATAINQQAEAEHAKVDSSCSLNQQLVVDENVQFSVFRPQIVVPQQWYPLLAFAHLCEKRPDASPDEPDPLQEMHRQARHVLGEEFEKYRSVTQDSSEVIPASGEITFLPEVDGFTFNPPRSTFLWLESVHRQDFRFLAPSNFSGKTARGRLTVFLGTRIIADVPLTFRVDLETMPQSRMPKIDVVSARPYRKVFASYSHQDSAIVQQFEQVASAFGDQYLRDSVALRTGEVWSERLAEMIEEADIFQLFWSRNSMHSIFVRQEWEQALSLNRPHFVRPVYWENPLPKNELEGLPPEPLCRIHFQHLALCSHDPTPSQDAPQPSCGPRKHAPAGYTNPSINARPQRMVKTRIRWLPLVATLLVVVIGLLGYFAWKGQNQHTFETNRAAFNSAMPWIKWIVYDPSGEYDPTQGKYPSVENIRRDLELLKQWGVKGLITTGSKGTLGEVARLAKETGFVMVIVGVWDPADNEDVANALKAAPYAAAYCIGNQAIHRGCSLANIQRTIDEVRQKTHKPATTSERLATYKTDATLCTIGDFLFPDSALDWQGPVSGSISGEKRAVTPAEAFEQVSDRAKEAASICGNTARPILLKMIGFPSGGADGFTEDTQAAFYTLVTRQYGGRPDIPGNVYFSFMTTFDPAWKLEENNWDAPERQIGLFRSNRTPKKAAAVFRDWTITK